MYTLNETLDRLIVAQDQLISEINSRLNFNTLSYVSNLSYSWETVFNANN